MKLNVVNQPNIYQGDEGDEHISNQFLHLYSLYLRHRYNWRDYLEKFIHYKKAARKIKLRCLL